MKYLKPILLPACLAIAALAACGTSQGGSPSSTTQTGGTTTGVAGGGNETTGTTTTGNPTSGNNTGAPVSPTGNGNVVGEANGTKTPGTDGNVTNANDSNSVAGNTGSGNANVTGSVAGQSFAPKSAIYGSDGNTVTVIISTDAQECNSITSGSTLGGSTAVQIALENFKNGAAQAFGNGNYTVSSTVSQTAPSATVALSLVDSSCKPVTVPGGTNASGGSCSVTSGGTSAHDNLKANATLTFAGTKLSGSFEAVYCDGLSKAMAAGGVKDASCHQ